MGLQLIPRWSETAKVTDLIDGTPATLTAGIARSGGPLHRIRSDHRGHLRHPAHAGGNHRARRPASLRKLRDELTDAVNYLEVGLFAVPGFSVFGMSDSARFAYIGHRPCTRASGRADEVLTFVVHPLIHADDDVGPGQARRSQLVAITRLSKFPDAILRKKLKCCSVRSQVSGPIHCGRGPARYSPQVLELEGVEVGLGNDAPKCVTPANEVNYHSCHNSSR